MNTSVLGRLTEFGLTINQAKVYLSTVKQGLISVNEIAGFTKLYRQDIYKVLGKLEKMGLITIKVNTPIMIEAIPVKKALNSLLSAERKKAKERLTRLEINSKELIGILGTQQQLKEKKEDPQFTLMKAYAAINNKADMTFENARINCSIVTNLELITQWKYYFHKHFQTLAEKQVKVRVIVETLENENENVTKKAIKKIIPNNSDFTVKLIRKSKSKPYHIIDQKELWIKTRKKTQSGFPCVLLTNSKNVIQLYEENFEHMWNNPQATNISIKKNMNRKVAVVQ